MIRAATLSDVPTISALGELFHAEAGWGDVAEYVAADCETTLRHLIENESGILLVAEEAGGIVGMAGGLCHPFYFNFSHKTGMEFFWWIKPGSRDGVGSRLLDALEGEARAQGCQSWIMIAVDRLAHEATGRLYRRRGYRPCEHTWIKRL